MKRMNLLLGYALLSVFLIGVSGGCKKSSVSPAVGDSYMRFKLNGAKKDYNFSSAVFIDGGSGIYALAVTGANTNDPSNDCSISLFSKTAFTEGTSFNAGLVPATYYTQATVAYVQGSSGYSSAGTIINSAAKVSVTITSLSSTYVKGVFSGNLYADGGNYTTVVYTVTEGEFNARR